MKDRDTPDDDENDEEEDYGNFCWECSGYGSCS